MTVAPVGRYTDASPNPTAARAACMPLTTQDGYRGVEYETTVNAGDYLEAVGWTSDGVLIGGMTQDQVDMEQPA